MKRRWWTPRTDSQARRRAVVVVLYLSYVLLVSCFALAGDGAARLFAVALLPVGATLMWAFWALSQIALPFTDQGAGVKLPPLDERQIQVRDRAFYRAYQIVSAVFGLWIVYESIARTSRRQWFWLPESFDEYQAIVWGYLLLAMTLPSAFIAWTEPDPPEHEERDREFRLAR